MWFQPVKSFDTSCQMVSKIRNLVDTFIVNLNLDLLRILIRFVYFFWFLYLLVTYVSSCRMFLYSSNNFTIGSKTLSDSISKSPICPITGLILYYSWQNMSLGSNASPWFSLVMRFSFTSESLPYWYNTVAMVLYFLVSL